MRTATHTAARLGLRSGRRDTGEPKMETSAPPRTDAAGPHCPAAKHELTPGEVRGSVVLIVLTLVPPVATALAIGLLLR